MELIGLSVFNYLNIIQLFNMLNWKQYINKNEGHYIYKNAVSILWLQLCQIYEFMWTEIWEKITNSHSVCGCFEAMDEILKNILFLLLISVIYKDLNTVPFLWTYWFIYSYASSLYAVANITLSFLKVFRIRQIYTLKIGYSFLT